MDSLWPWWGGLKNLGNSAAPIFGIYFCALGYSVLLPGEVTGCCFIFYSFGFLGLLYCRCYFWLFLPTFAIFFGTSVCGTAGGMRGAAMGASFAIFTSG